MQRISIDSDLRGLPALDGAISCQQGVRDIGVKLRYLNALQSLMTSKS